MDGITTKQDLLASGKGTLDVILKNLQDISSLDQAQYSFHITIRHNILKDDTDFTWYDYLYQYFGKDGRFSVLIRPIGDWEAKLLKSLTYFPYLNVIILFYNILII